MPVLLGVGGGLAIVALVWITVLERRRDQFVKKSPPHEFTPDTARNWLWMMVLIVGGALLRIHGIDSTGLSHPEIYIPGILFPEGISQPPPRIGFAETAVWHFHSEPHPFGFYLASWSWTKLFGTSAVALRLPSVIMGIASIFLIFRVGSLSHSCRVGWIAALMLAFHGFHLYWSQMARMYVPGTFLGLLATLLLLKISRGRREVLHMEAAYVLLMLAGTLTVEFFWPLLAVHMGWVFLFHPGTQKHIPRILSVQTLAVILCSPMLLHAAYTARQHAVPEPTLRFLIDYFSFGFLFLRDYLSDPIWQPPLAAALTFLLVALILVLRGLKARPQVTQPEKDSRSALQTFPLALVATGMATIIVGLACVLYKRQILISLVVIPLGALTIPLAAAVAGPTIHRIRSSVFEKLPWVESLCSPIALLALLPVLGMFLASFLVSVMAPRAFLIFTPYLIILIAAGVTTFGRRTAIIVMTAVLVVLFASSVLYFKKKPHSPYDYRGLGAVIVKNMEPGDLIFVRPRSWLYTPLFYYLPYDQIIGRHYTDALSVSPNARVWVPIMGGLKPSRRIIEALSDHRLAKKVTAARGAFAVLYER